MSSRDIFTIPSGSLTSVCLQTKNLESEKAEKFSAKIPTMDLLDSIMSKMDKPPSINDKQKKMMKGGDFVWLRGVAVL